MNKFKLLTLSSLALATTLIPASASTTVKIETKSTYMNVTVPTSIEFVFNEDGTNTLPTNFVITNNSPMWNYIRNFISFIVIEFTNKLL